MAVLAASTWILFWRRVTSIISAACRAAVTCSGFAGAGETFGEALTLAASCALRIACALSCALAGSLLAGFRSSLIICSQAGTSARGSAGLLVPAGGDGWPGEPRGVP